MHSRVVANTTNEVCNHGWLHTDRIYTDTTQRNLIEPGERKALAMSFTLEDADEAFKEGREALNLRHFAEAIDHFFAAIQLRWDFPEAHIELANSYSGLNQYEKALEAYSSAIETDPSSPIAHYNIAMTFIDIKQIETAREWLQRTIELNPHYHLAYSQLGILLDALKQPAKAIYYLLKAARLSRPRTNPDILVHAGMLYEQLYCPKPALRCYQRALRINPWHAEAFYRQGLTQFREGDLNLANLSLANALNTRPDHPEAKALLKEIKKLQAPKKTPRKRKKAQNTLFPDEAEAA